MGVGYVPIRNILPNVSPNMVYEVILTTKSRDGEVDAAPIGLRFLNDDLSRFLLRIYKETKTYKNLIEKPVGVVNITRDPAVFVKYLMKDKDKYLREEVEDSEVVDVARLRNAEAYIEFTVENIYDEASLADFHSIVVKAYEGVRIIEPYSRAAYALIELAVNISKVEPYLKQGLELSELFNAIAYCLKVIKKSATGTVIDDYSKILLSSLSENSSSLLKQHLLRSGIHLK
jgi:hypothetical protein